MPLKMLPLGVWITWSWTMPEMRFVYSSHIDEIGHDPDNRSLHVKYSNGKTVVYGGADDPIPQEVISRVLSSPSIGSALHAEIRGKYRHRYA
jgi:hypothetical protein